MKRPLPRASRPLPAVVAKESGSTIAWVVSALVASALPAALALLPAALPERAATATLDFLPHLVRPLAAGAVALPLAGLGAVLVLARARRLAVLGPLIAVLGAALAAETLGAAGAPPDALRVGEAAVACLAPLFLCRGLRRGGRRASALVVLLAASAAVTLVVLDPGLGGRVPAFAPLAERLGGVRASLVALQLLACAGLLVMPGLAVRAPGRATVGLWVALLPQVAAHLHILAGGDLAGLAAADAARLLRASAAGLVLAGVVGEGLAVLAALKAGLARAERSAARTNAILDTVADGIVLADERGRIQSLNLAAEQLFGHRTDDVLGHDVSRLITSLPETDAPERLGIGDVRGLASREETGQRRDGATFPLSVVVSELEHAGRRLTAWILSDLTQLKRAEEERDRFFSLSPIAMFVATLDGAFTRVNRVYCNAVGRRPVELVGQSLFDLVHPDDRRATAQMMARVGKGRPIFSFESRSLDGAGQATWFSWSVGAALKDGLLYAVGLDVTDRKRRAQELHSSWRYARDLFEVNPNPIAVVTRDGTITDLNREAVELFGPRSECVGSPLALHFADPLAAGGALRRVQEEGEIEHWPLELLNADGELRQVTLNACEYRNDADEVQGILAVIQDVTKERMLEAHLLEAQKLESIGQLAAGIAHEINTPTQYVMDNVRFLADAFEDLSRVVARVDGLVAVEGGEAEREAALAELRAEVEAADTEYLLEEIPRAVEQSCEGLERVAQIVRAMKEFSHPGRREKSTVDLNHAIENTVTVARNEWKYVAELELDLDPELPPVPCLESELNQVVLNLIVNAAHAIAEARAGEELGRIRVCTRARDGHAEIQVSDTGVGIPEELRTKVFDLFFTTKAVGLGTGQGLALAHAVVVEKHRGRIWFESRVGRGTTFHILLPLEAKLGAAA